MRAGGAHDADAVRLPGGDEVVQLGQGTWRMGERRAAFKDEVAALRHGIACGMTLIDTAEMYGSGGAERVVREAIRGMRDAVYLVSKVLPSNAGRKRMARACEKSLKHLGSDRLDLYLLHWRGAVSLDETVEGFLALQEAGKIRHFGVSNFDTGDMGELWQTAGGRACQTNQILHNLHSRRWPEASLMDWSRRHGQPLMVYSPLEQGPAAGDGCPRHRRRGARRDADAGGDSPGRCATPTCSSCPRRAASPMWTRTWGRSTSRSATTSLPPSTAPFRRPTGDAPLETL